MEDKFVLFSCIEIIKLITVIAGNSKTDYYMFNSNSN